MSARTNETVKATNSCFTIEVYSHENHYCNNHPKFYTRFEYYVEFRITRVLQWKDNMSYLNISRIDYACKYLKCAPEDKEHFCRTTG